MTQVSQNLIWIDCEFTGLDFSRNKTLEVACVCTDSDLNLLDQGIRVVINHSKEQVDDLLEDWPRQQFEKTGLLDEVYASSVNMSQAQQILLDYVGRWTAKGVSPLCGNSVGQDRRVLYKDMPELEEWFHYRNIDVSTVKELARRWKPEVIDQVIKQETHQAMNDILESIAELKVYKKFFMIN